MGIRRQPALSGDDKMKDDATDDHHVETSKFESDSQSEPEDVQLDAHSLDSEPESEPEDVKLAEPSKTSIYNREGLLDKLGDISWPENIEWIQKLCVDINQEQEVDVNDDLSRELSFYTQALEGARQAFDKLEAMKLPFLRPSDFYAEMVKTDTHMEKIKSRLLVEKKKIEEAEERKKARESKKIAKEVQAQKMKERAKQKKEDIESVKKWRKQRQQSGYDKNEKNGASGFPFEEGNGFEKSSKRRPGVAPGDRSGGRGKLGGMGKKMKKRESRDSKFGFGGRKGLKKQNTAETTNDLRGFSKNNFSGNKKRKR